MKTRLILLAALLITVTGFAQKNKKNGKSPAWIDNPYAAYKEADYLLSVGSGDTQQAAQNAALGNISRVFQAEIKADQQLVENVRETQSNGGKLSSERSEQLLNVTRIGSSTNLVNTQVLETFQKDGTYYALAGMKRKETGAIYSQEIRANEEKITAFETSATTEANKLQKLKLYKSALTLLALNDNLRKQRAIILQGRSTGDDQEQANRIMQAYRDHQKVCLVAIKSENAAPSLTDAVAKVFTDQGFSIATTETPILEATVAYTAEEMNLGQPNVFTAKWLLTIRLSDLETSRQVQAFTTEGRDSKIGNYQAALTQADFSARKKIDADFKKYLDREFLSSTK